MTLKTHFENVVMDALGSSFILTDKKVSMERYLNMGNGWI